MSEDPASAPVPKPDRAMPSVAAEPVAPRVTVEPPEYRNRWDFLPLLYLAGFVVLAGSLVYLWQNPPASKTETQQAGRVDDLQGQIAGLRDQVGQLGALRQQVDKLSSQVAGGASAADLNGLRQQLAALAARPAMDPAVLTALNDKVTGLQNRPAVDPATVQQLVDKIAGLEARKVVTPEQLALLSDQVQKVGRDVPDIKPLEQKITALEARPTFDPAAIDGRLADLSGKVGQATSATTQLATRMEAIDKQQAALSEQLKALTQKAQITARLQGMAAALAAGQKLGEIPGAPPALARFATEAPPTESALRESFDRYAAAAQQASQPAITDKQDFGARLWTRAQQAVTVRQGDRVLVGDPIAGVMAGARAKLENGDLAGAVQALKGLAGPAAAAMQPWTEKAEALVAARSAIASLAAN